MPPHLLIYQKRGSNNKHFFRSFYLSQGGVLRQYNQGEVSQNVSYSIDILENPKLLYKI